LVVIVVAPPSAKLSVSDSPSETILSWPETAIVL
jgi:hypothetical protein